MRFHTTAPTATENRKTHETVVDVVGVVAQNSHRNLWLFARSSPSSRKTDYFHNAKNVWRVRKMAEAAIHGKQYRNNTCKSRRFIYRL